MSRIGVMHLVDTLVAGGRERSAVNLVNLLPRSQYQLHLCVTRAQGPLSKLVEADVGRLELERKHLLDIAAVKRLIAFIKSCEIQILHAHGDTLFIAVIASLFSPFPKVVWHDHYGEHSSVARPAWIYRVAVSRTRAIIGVNQDLVDWARVSLGMQAGKVWYIQNFVTMAEPGSVLSELPGTAGKRIVCVANIRIQKDHLTLIRAMARVVQKVPDAHLLLVGAATEKSYFELVQMEIAQQGLQHSISLLGTRQDVSAILQASDIGVMSSISEGLPLALLEYGMAGLPAVVTRVGQCAEVLAGGDAGVLVPPSSHELLAEELILLLGIPHRRVTLGKVFQQRVQEVYSQAPVLKQISQLYEDVLKD